MTGGPLGAIVGGIDGATGLTKSVDNRISDFSDSKTAIEAKASKALTLPM